MFHHTDWRRGHSLRGSREAWRPRCWADLCPWGETLKWANLCLCVSPWTIRTFYKAHINGKYSLLLHVWFPFATFHPSERSAGLGRRMLEHQGEPACLSRSLLVEWAGFLAIREVKTKGRPGSTCETDPFIPKRYQMKGCDHVLVILLSPS